MTMRRIGRAFIADSARVLGDVELGEDVSLWYGAVARGDVGPIRIGDRCNVQDNVVIHCDEAVPNLIGCDVTMGHGAIVHGAEVGDGSLVGIGARLLAGTRIGKRCIVAAGAVVPPDLVVPDDMVVMGIPGRVVRTTTGEERRYMADVPPRYVRLARLHVEHPDDPRVLPYAG